ncbi:Yip1 family protein [Pseudomonas lini]
MSAPFVRLFTQPNFVWTDIRKEEEAHPRHYLAHLLLLALIPAVCLFIGTTYVGWSLVENETVRLTTTSALQLCGLLYLSIIVGVVLMGLFIRWMSRTFDSRPNVNQCIGFAAYTVTPFFFSRVSPGCTPAAGWRSRCWGAASIYSTFLLFVGLPIFMHERREQGLLNAASLWGVGLLVLVTILVEMILLWSNYLRPEYLRVTGV